MRAAAAGVRDDGVELVGRELVDVPAREALRENSGAGKIGTTGKGIGPAYEDKVARRALRAQDLKHPERFAKKLRELLDLHNFALKGKGVMPPKGGYAGPDADVIAAADYMANAAK